LSEIERLFRGNGFFGKMRIFGKLEFFRGKLEIFSGKVGNFKEKW
jgi:hypothetical protein